MKMYYILNYYYGCANVPDWTRPTKFYLVALIHCKYLNWTQRKYRNIEKQKFEVTSRKADWY